MLVHPHKYKEPLWYYLLLHIEAGRHNREKAVRYSGETHLHRTILYYTCLKENCVKSTGPHLTHLSVAVVSGNKDIKKNMSCVSYIFIGLDVLNDSNSST